MPLYEYKCLACHRHTEKIQKFSDPEITVCPHCGGDLNRVITAPAFSLKGGGWYADGYGNSKPPAATGSDAASSDKPAAPASDTPAAAAAPATPAAAPSAPAPASGTK